jgi:hypothetical protein
MGQTQQQPTEPSGEVIHWLVYQHASTPNSTVLVPSITLPRTDLKKYQPEICSNDYKLS